LIVSSVGFNVAVSGFPPGSLWEIPARHASASIRTWTGVDGTLSEEAIARMTREFLRDCGVPQFEPEPPAAPD